jgi:hypothetical protein
MIFITWSSEWYVHDLWDSWEFISTTWNSELYIDTIYEITEKLSLQVDGSECISKEIEEFNFQDMKLWILWEIPQI